MNTVRERHSSSVWWEGSKSIFYVFGGYGRERLLIDMEILSLDENDSIENSKWVTHKLNLGKDTNIGNVLCRSFVIPHPTQERFLLLGGEETTESNCKTQISEIFRVENDYFYQVK